MQNRQSQLQQQVTNTLESPGGAVNRSAQFALAAVLALGSGGCIDGGAGGNVQTLWGRQGVKPGDFQKPRAIAVNSQDELYLVDMTARIQVFDADGNFLRGWKSPASKNGRPSGLSFDRQGRLLVADTHYYRVLTYTADGDLLQQRTIGGALGQAPGEFGFVTDAVEDSKGNLYVGEYGDNDRIQKFSPTGDYLVQWGGHGEEPGQFRRPQNLAVDDDDRIWVTDACNHRIQVFSSDGDLLAIWGEEGSDVGQLYYPYDLVLDGKGSVYICEYGNHRVQKFSLDGTSLGIWGSHGRDPGQLHNPWALALDSQARLHVVDSNNHRVQRVVF